LHREIEVAPNVVLGMVRAGLARLSGREKVTVRVNPGDLATMREHREAFQNTADVESLRIVEDQRVDRGGVVIETESGTIDAKIGTQLREVRRVFAPDEPVALPAAGENPLRSPAQAS
jgi:flagellar assembly protein FliH